MALLPWELEEDILSRLPPQSLAKFRSVCKRWNALLSEKSFINNHFARARPQFIFITNSNIYSIDIIGLDGVDPTIKLRELASSGIPYRELNFNYTTITTCDEFLFCSYWAGPTGSALWNPWLRQVKWIDYTDKKFDVCGLGYDNTKPERVYKMFGYFMCRREVERNYYRRVAIYECASHAFKFIDTPNEDYPICHSKPFGVSLNGNLYWIAIIPNTSDLFIRSFDFSREIFKPFSLLPCPKNQSCNQLVLGVFKGDRLSLLKQCFETSKVEIWVTKKKIDDNNNNRSEEVVWINLKTLPTTNLPNFFNMVYGISYFIYDKTTLIMCCGNAETGAASIYIVRGDFFKKIQIDSGFFRCCHCVYTPNFIPIP